MNGFYEALLMATGIMYLYALISCQLLFFCRKSIKRNKTKLKLIIFLIFLMLFLFCMAIGTIALIVLILLILLK